MSSFPLVPLSSTRVSDEAAFSVHFLPVEDGYILSAGSDESLKCWELKYADDESAKKRTENLSLMWSVSGAHPLGVMSVSASADGSKIATTGVRGDIALWSSPLHVGSSSSSPNAKMEKVAVGPANASPLDAYKVAYNPATDNTRANLVSGSYSGAINLWSVLEERHESTMDMDDDGLGLGEDLHLSSSSSSSSATISIEKASSTNSLRGSFAMCVAFCPDGLRAAAGHADGTVSILDVTTGKLVTTLEAHLRCVRDISWAPVPRSGDGSLLYTASDDGRIGVFDAANGSSYANVSMLTGHTSFVSSIAACTTRPGYVASGGADRSVKLWDIRRPISLQSYDVHNSTVTALSWAPEKCVSGPNRLASVSESGFLCLHQCT